MIVQIEDVHLLYCDCFIIFFSFFPSEMLTVDNIVKFGSDFIPVNLNFSYRLFISIDDVHPRRRSRADFGLVLMSGGIKVNMKL